MLIASKLHIDLTYQRCDILISAYLDCIKLHTRALNHTNVVLLGENKRQNVVLCVCCFEYNKTKYCVVLKTNVLVS